MVPSYKSLQPHIIFDPVFVSMCNGQKTESILEIETTKNLRGKDSSAGFCSVQMVQEETSASLALNDIFAKLGFDLDL